MIHDITLAISPSLVVWKDGVPVRMEQRSSIARGDSNTNTQLSLSAHTGTHVDAPAHFVGDGYGVDQLPLEVLVGPALVIEVPDGVDEITADVLDALAIPPGTVRVLFKTRNSDLWAQAHTAFDTGYVGVVTSGAEWLVAHDVKLVGVDYLSVAAWSDLVKTHQVLLGAEVVIVEGLNLHGIAPGLYQLVCLPMKLAGCDGAPTRAILIEM
ncbi:MAG: cyclase family protein [Anaerolineae bacterium]|nr:cyclase family protein [Anaerolineae bacterium]